MRSKGIVLIQDGVGDQPVEELGDLTPLEAARTPVMDRLAAGGQSGLMDVVAPGLTARTHVGHLILFGQQVRTDAPRGPIEAAGIGVELDPGEVALRFNFGTIGGDGVLIDRRANRIRKGSTELVAALNTIGEIDDVGVKFFAATEHRGVLTLQGPGLSAAISNSDPSALSTPREVQPLDSSSEARHTADVVNSVLMESHERLQNHPVNQRRTMGGLLPANCILTRGAGMSQAFQSFPVKFGLATACVSGEATVLGAARLSGISAVTSPAMTAGLDSDLEEKSLKTLECLEEHDLVFLHIKGCDIAAHDRNPRAKKEFIERTDEMLGRLLDAAGPGVTFAAVSDHATVCSTGEHSPDPVPVLINGPRVTPDRVRRYGERFSAHGTLGRMLGRDFPGVLCRLLAGRPSRALETGKVLGDIVVQDQAHQREDEDHSSLGNP